MRNRELTFTARSEIENADRKAKAFVEKFLNSQILDKNKNLLDKTKNLLDKTLINTYIDENILCLADSFHPSSRRGILESSIRNYCCPLNGH